MRSSRPEREHQGLSTVLVVKVAKWRALFQDLKLSSTCPLPAYALQTGAGVHTVPGTVVIKRFQAQRVR
jgi:hypothetical protein